MLTYAADPYLGDLRYLLGSQPAQNPPVTSTWPHPGKHLSGVKLQRWSWQVPSLAKLCARRNSMALVDYSESSESEDEVLAAESNLGQAQGSRKRKAEHVEDTHVQPVKSRPPPPLPPSFHSLYATNVRTSAADDPSLHAGRTRQVPHAVGNWPTHIYLEWHPSPSELATLESVIHESAVTKNRAEASTGSIHSFLHSDLGVQLPLHISLSAPLVLKTEQKESFENSIGSKLAHTHVKSFAVKVTKLDWVANHDKTRFFLVLKLSKPENDDLNQLLAMCNDAAYQFDLPQLYDNADKDRSSLEDPVAGKTQDKVADKSDTFHISVAWTLEEPDDRARRRLIDVVDGQLRGLQVSFSLLKLKIGSTVIDLPLAQNQQVGT